VSFPKILVYNIVYRNTRLLHRYFWQLFYFSSSDFSEEQSSSFCYFEPFPAIHFKSELLFTFSLRSIYNLVCLNKAKQKTLPERTRKTEQWG